MRSLKIYLVYLVALIPLLLFIPEMEYAIDPYDDWLNLTGITMMLLFIPAVLIGPLTRAYRPLSRLHFLRQPLGVAGWTYAGAHIAGYFIFHQSPFNEATIAILQKPFLILGLVAFLVLTALAITSNQYAMRALKTNWRSLHSYSMAAVTLGAAHGLVGQKTAINEFGLFFLILVLIAAIRLKQQWR